jgi:MarR family transcriptional regulator, organic hydroperoxide resistance regulator
MLAEAIAPVEDFDLETFVPYLLNRAGVHIAAGFAQELQRFGISLQVWRLLASLLHQDQQKLMDLAAHTSVEASTVSRVVGAMQRKGLVNRRRSGADARSVVISLTEKGRSLALQILPLAQLYERIALAGFAADEVAQLKRLLTRLYENISSLATSASKPPPVATRSRRARIRL